MTTRGERAVQWIETHCSEDDGMPVALCDTTRGAIREIFDDPTIVECVRQLFACGPEARTDEAYDARIGADGWPAEKCE
jgi:hypothetical protein